MAKSIDFSVATPMNSGSFIQLQVVITENGTVLSERNYNFNANQYSAVYDNYSPNVAVFHFGSEHTLSITNGDYATYSLAGFPQATPIALAAAVGTDIAQYTT